MKVLPTGLWVVVYEFYGEKACSELADFYKEYSQKKNRYVSVEFVENLVSGPLTSFSKDFIDSRKIFNVCADSAAFEDSI